jgi:exonuclease III
MARHKENIDNCVVDLIIEKKCDLIVLAEYYDNVYLLCQKANSLSEEKYKPIPNNGGCDRISGLINEKYIVDSIHEQSRYQIVKVETPVNRLIVAMVHNISKLFASDETQAENLRRLHEDIRKEEIKFNTSNTILVGDFNVNPFERACISANTLHAIPFLQEARRMTRTVQEVEYNMLYSPMWKLYGNDEPPYTPYYNNTGDMTNYFWHIFDQVLLRPHIADAFDNSSLEIVTGTKSHTLVGRNNRPDKNNYSDHLPLFFTLKEGILHEKSLEKQL